MPEPDDRFHLRPSRTATVWTAAVHGGGVLALWGSAVPPEAAGILTVITACSFTQGLRLHALRSAGRAVAWIEIGRGLRVGFADGRRCEARLRSRPVVTDRLVVLRLETDDGHTTVLVPPDALSSRARHKAIRREARHAMGP
ncbi:MAG: hypothetical protein OXC01_09340 [Immundisolibacterales bacterium]|nr:hypothetical protein [Immundisolibacterales bacterium]